MHRNILTDTITIGVLTTLAKLAGGVKTVVIARYFGRGDQLDAYLLAFLIPSFAGDVLGGAITQSLLPVFVEVRESKGRDAAHQLYSSVLWGSLALLAIIAVLVAIFSTSILQLIAGGFSPAKIELTRKLLLIMLPIIPSSSLNVTWRTLLNADERFAIPALAPLVTPLSIMAFVVAFGPQWGIHSLAAGSLAGGLLEVVIVGVAVRATGIKLFSRWTRSPSTSRVVSEYVPMASSNLISGGSSVVDQSMAAMLGSGSVSTLNYGTRLATVMLAIGPAALGTAILPRLARLTAAGKWTEFRQMIRIYGLLSIAATIPVTIGLIYFSEPLVRLFFERGAFTRGDTSAVALVQSLSLLQIPFSVVLALLVRVVSSLKQNRLLLNLAVISLAVNIVFDLVLMRWYGVGGIALSTTAVHAVGVAYIGVMTFRRVREQGQNS